MTWLEAYHLLIKEHQVLNRALQIQGKDYSSLGFAHPQVLEEIPVVFEAAERSQRDTLDQAVKKFARERIWPDLTLGQQFLLTHRLLFGSFLTASIATPYCLTGTLFFPSKPENFGDVEMVEWLLISCWRSTGHGLWIYGMRQQNIGFKAGLDQLSESAPMSYTANSNFLPKTSTGGNE